MLITNRFIHKHIHIYSILLIFSVLLSILQGIPGLVFTYTAQIAEAAERQYMWPVPDSRQINQYYSGSHDGIDIGASWNVPIVASKSGTVFKEIHGDEKNWIGYGNGIVINHGDGYFTHYAHMSSTAVTQGQYVTQGQVIGYMGSTGNSTGRHLHFSIATGQYGAGGRIDNNVGSMNYIYSTQQSQSGVTFGEQKVLFTQNTNAEVYTKILNPSGMLVTRVGCYLYNSSGLVKTYFEDCNFTTSYVNYNCNFNNDMMVSLTPGTSYRYILYAIVNGTEYKDTESSFTTTGLGDVEPPVISDPKVVEIDSLGYVVECTVTDNVSIDRVQCPTWTSNNNQDDIASDWEHNSAVRAYKHEGKYRFRVNISDHNNEYGLYNTHIYAYDSSGNKSTSSQNTCGIQIQTGIRPVDMLVYKDMILSVYNENMSWDLMNSFATVMKSRLVEVESADKNAIVSLLLNKQFKTYYYMGAAQLPRLAGAPWKWQSGDNLTYTNWDGAQPDCAGNNEYFLSMISSTGTWNDLPDNFDAGFVMETPLDLKPDAVTEIDGIVYEFYNANLSYDTARYFCSLNDKQLAKISSEKVNMKLAKVATEQDRPYRIGATDVKEECKFVWQDGTPLTYSNWSVGEPNDYSSNGGEDYAVLYPSGEWNDEGVQGSNGFIAEYKAKSAVQTTSTPLCTVTEEPGQTSHPVKTIQPSQTASTSAKTDSPSQTVVPTQTNELDKTNAQEPANNIEDIPNESEDSLDDTEEIYVAKGKIKTLSCTGKGKLKVLVTKVYNAEYYEVLISENKTFKKSVKRVRTQKNVVKVSKLKKGRYYIKLRGYAETDGRRFYGQWSKLRKIKIK